MLGRLFMSEAKNKKAIAQGIVKRLNMGNKTAVSIYKRGFLDFAQFVQAGGSGAEIKELLTTGKLPEGMRARRKKPETSPAQQAGQPD
jgi:glycerol-3-phosphate dehydrogenase